MKKQKKLIACTLACALILGMSHSGMGNMKVMADNATGTQTVEASSDSEASADSTVTSDFTYTVLDETEKTCSITGYTGTEMDVLIPDAVNGYTVTGIGEQAFYYCSNLTSISIPEGVTSIGKMAFYGCSGLTSISIPDSVTAIDMGAFADCSGLTSISIPEGVTSISKFVFQRCSRLTSISIPEGVTYIGAEAFEGCSGLTSISIPEGVTYIGAEAFESCHGLTSISIPEGVTSIRRWTFCDCSGLTSISIPNSVTIIDYQAFEGCSALTSISIPERVTSIRSDSFSGCNSLATINNRSNTVITLSNVNAGPWYDALTGEEITTIAQGTAVHIYEEPSSEETSEAPSEEATEPSTEAPTEEITEPSTETPGEEITEPSIEAPGTGSEDSDDDDDSNDVSVPEEKFNDAVISEITSPDIQVIEKTVTTEGAIKPDIFETLKETGKTFEIKVQTPVGDVLAIISINGKTITNADVTFNLGMSVDNAQGAIQSALEDFNLSDVPSTQVDFDFSGELPGPMDISINVARKFDNGTKVTLFYYNPVTGALENQNQTSVVENGFVPFTFTHFSQYVLIEADAVPAELAAAPDTTTDNTTNVVKTGDSANVMLYIILAAVGVFGLFTVCISTKRKEETL